MTLVRDTPVSEHTLEDLDRATTRRALRQALGAVLLWLLVPLFYVVVWGFSWGAILYAILGSMVLTLLVLGLSFIFGEPALEVFLKGWLHRETTEIPTETSSPEELTPLDVPLTWSTNEAQVAYDTSLGILRASLAVLSRERADGETLKGRPWTYQRCLGAKLVKDYTQWREAMNIWERSGIVRPNVEGSLVVNSTAEAIDRFDSLYESDGYMLVNKVWRKR